MELYEGQLSEYEWDITVIRNHHKGKKAKKICNNIICFDTENSSAWINEDGDVIGYTPGLSEDYWNSLEAISLCYIWMCAVDDRVFYGRELKTFCNLINDLPDAEISIWVHNLAYDFSAALINVLDFGDVFARSPHKPIKASLKNKPNITFKCTYALTNLSLEMWGKMIGVEKKKGDLDYNQLYTPLSELDEKSLGYCEADVRVMVAGVRKYIERFGSMQEIPMTKTGIVRKKTKEILCTPYYMKRVKKLIPFNAAEYKVLQDVFVGGYTHANRWYSMQTITVDEVGYIGHRDFASSYPTWTICAKVPCSPWVIDGQYIPNLRDIEKNAYIIKIEMWDVICQTYNTYIPVSRCSTLEEPLIDNGRLISAKHLIITITELDWYIIRKSYKIGKKKSLCTWKSEKDYLPDDFRAYILDLYEAKTKWKKVEGYEDIYMNAKGDINSASFGMMVSAIVFSEIQYNNGQWSNIPLTEEVVNEKLLKLRKYFPNDKRYFLSYSWGIWVCGYARTFGLWDCILSLDTPAHKNNVLYCDTDSIFYIGEQNFDWYDKMIDRRLKEACEEGGLDFSKTRPKDRHGVEYPLGHFQKEEETITEFRTLGAKRYCVRLKEDNKLHLTVAGINKEAVDVLDDDIENFKDGTVFDKDHPSVHKLLHTYTVNQSKAVWPDGYVSSQEYGVNMRPTGYTLEIKDEYERLIEFLDFIIDDIQEENFISIRSKIVDG